MIDDIRFRLMVVRGWAFRQLPQEQKTSIREYLATGNREVLPDSYRELANKLDSSDAELAEFTPGIRHQPPTGLTIIRIARGRHRDVREQYGSTDTASGQCKYMHLARTVL